MNILGLIGWGYNPGAALVRDGKLVAHSEEERFTRYKGSHFHFPRKAMAWMLKDQGLTLDDIDCIAWAWDQDLYRFQMPLFFGKQFLRYGWRSGGGSGSNALVVLNQLLQQQPDRIRQQIALELRACGVPGRIPPVKFFPHHLCHAASSYYLSGFDESHVLVIDGSGEKYCTSLYYGDGNTLSEVEHLEIPNSLGWFYAAITEYLGFIPYRDEGKVMGLAAYGSHDQEIFEKMARIIRIDPLGYSVDPSYTLLGKHSHGAHFSDALMELFGARRLYDAPVDQKSKNIAYAAQDYLERAALALLNRLQARHSSSNLCLAGGVTLNCKMNGVLARQPGIKQLFVQPSANDAGSSIGAALLAANEASPLARQRLSHTYYGSCYSNLFIKTKLDNDHLHYVQHDHIAERVAQALAENKIVAVYQGRGEFGARALGHRSILANPFMPDASNAINQRVKFREPWRPFCPSLLSEDRERYMKHPMEAPFMAVANEMKEEWQQLLQSIVHVDGSIRPQTVTREDHPFMWQCISAFKKLSGHGIVINTSFNVRGQPMVESPDDAIACFYATGLDALAIGDFWLEKSVTR